MISLKRVSAQSNVDSIANTLNENMDTISRFINAQSSTSTLESYSKKEDKAHPFGGSASLSFSNKYNRLGIIDDESIIEKNSIYTTDGIVYKINDLYGNKITIGKASDGGYLPINGTAYDSYRLGGIEAAYYATKYDIKNHTHNYLPLIGGTLTGLLTLNNFGKTSTDRILSVSDGSKRYLSIFGDGLLASLRANIADLGAQQVLVTTEIESAGKLFSGPRTDLGGVANFKSSVASVPEYTFTSTLAGPHNGIYRQVGTQTYNGEKVWTHITNTTWRMYRILPAGSGTNYYWIITNQAYPPTPNDNAYYTTAPYRQAVAGSAIKPEDFSFDGNAIGYLGTNGGVVYNSGVTLPGFVADKCQVTTAPVAGSDIVNKTYADSLLAQTITDGVTTSAPSQNAVFDALVLKAPTSHASTATTYGVGTVNNYGHVKSSALAPLMNGTAAIGTDNAIYARGDHVHPTDTSRAASAHNQAWSTITSTPTTTTGYGITDISVLSYKTTFTASTSLSSVTGHTYTYDTKTNSSGRLYVHISAPYNQGNRRACYIIDWFKDVNGDTSTFNITLSPATVFTNGGTAQGDPTVRATAVAVTGGDIQITFTSAAFPAATTASVSVEANAYL